MSDTQSEAKEQTNGAASANGSSNSIPDAKDSANTNANNATPDTTMDSAQVVSGVETDLSSVQAKAAEYLEGWQRSRAEFANYKKRAEKEREDIYQIAAADTLKKILPIIDDLDRAVSNLPVGKEEDDLIKGFVLIHRKLLSLLENSGIKIVNPKGEVFNPDLHEAIGTDESSDVESGHVSAVLQKGYMYGDKVLRHAMVRVAS
jgi:molecular chaperone GrpE